LSIGGVKNLTVSGGQGYEEIDAFSWIEITFEKNQ
jgi:hypothetical protein